MNTEFITKNVKVVNLALEFLVIILNFPSILFIINQPINVVLLEKRSQHFGLQLFLTFIGDTLQNLWNTTMRTPFKFYPKCFAYHNVFSSLYNVKLRPIAFPNPQTSIYYILLKINCGQDQWSFTQQNFPPLYFSNTE